MAARLKRLFTVLFLWLLCASVFAFVAEHRGQFPGSSTALTAIGNTFNERDAFGILIGNTGSGDPESHTENSHLYTGELLNAGGQAIKAALKTELGQNIASRLNPLNYRVAMDRMYSLPTLPVKYVGPRAGVAAKTLPKSITHLAGSDQPVVLIGRSMDRVKRAADQLRSQGFKVQTWDPKKIRQSVESYGGQSFLAAILGQE